MAKIDQKGRWINSKGEALHPDLVRKDEVLRDQLVEDLCAHAGDICNQLAYLKRHAENEIRTFFSLMMEKYEINPAAKTTRGNFILNNYSNTARVEVRTLDRMEFDEKIQLAKMKMDEYLDELTKDSGAEIKTLINEAFRVDKSGKIDSKRVLALRKIDIKAPLWTEAMALINESIQISAGRRYVRFFIRESIDDEWLRIPLNITEITDELEADEELCDEAAAWANAAENAGGEPTEISE